MDKPTEAAHGIMASIQDPSGNILDLYQPTPEKIKELAEKLKMEMHVAVAMWAENAAIQEADSCCKSEANQRGCC